MDEFTDIEGIRIHCLDVAMRILEGGTLDDVLHAAEKIERYIVGQRYDNIITLREVK